MTFALLFFTDALYTTTPNAVVLPDDSFKHRRYQQADSNFNRYSSTIGQRLQSLIDCVVIVNKVCEQLLVCPYRNIIGSLKNEKKTKAECVHAKRPCIVSEIEWCRQAEYRTMRCAQRDRLPQAPQDGVAVCWCSERNRSLALSHTLWHSRPKSIHWLTQTLGLLLDENGHFGFSTNQKTQNREKTSCKKLITSCASPWQIVFETISKVLKWVRIPIASSCAGAL